MVAALTATSSGKKVSIPVPECAFEIGHYASIYKSNFRMPKYLIKCISKVEERISVPYNMDAADEKWLSALNSNVEREEQRLQDIHFEVLFNYFDTNYKVNVNFSYERCFYGA